MKTTNKIILALAIMLVAFTTENKATVITVSNNGITAGQYTGLQAAISAATSGDTIYVHGSLYDYGTVVVDRQLTIIGAGYRVTGTLNNFSTIVSAIRLALGSNGTTIIGVNSQIFYSGGLGDPHGVSHNVTISRCAGSVIVCGSGWIIENSIVSIGIDLGITVCLIRNNILSGISFNNSSGVSIDHNIIQGAAQGISFASVTNNVFFYADESAVTNINSCTFDNNITVSSTSDVLPFGTNTGTNNINNASDSNLFAGGMSAIVTYPTIATSDWHILAGSPAHNAGTDGTDLGIYGGTQPMANLTGASNLFPQMTLLELYNTNVPVNGNLNVRFKARKQD